MYPGRMVGVGTVRYGYTHARKIRKETCKKKRGKKTDQHEHEGERATRGDVFSRGLIASTILRLVRQKESVLSVFAVGWRQVGLGWTGWGRNASVSMPAPFCRNTLYSRWLGPRHERLNATPTVVMNEWMEWMAS